MGSNLKGVDRPPIQARALKKKKFTTYHFAKTDADVGIRRKITRLNILRIFILRERAMGGIVI